MLQVIPNWKVIFEYQDKSPFLEIIISAKDHWEAMKIAGQIMHGTKNIQAVKILMMG